MKNTTKRVLRNTGLIGAGVVTLFAMKGCKNDPDPTPDPKPQPTCPCPADTVHAFGTDCPETCTAKGTANCGCTIDVQREFAHTLFGKDVTIKDSTGAASGLGEVLDIVKDALAHVNQKTNLTTKFNAVYTANGNKFVVEIKNGLDETASTSDKKGIVIGKSYILETAGKDAEWIGNDIAYEIEFNLVAINTLNKSNVRIASILPKLNRQKIALEAVNVKRQLL